MSETMTAAAPEIVADSVIQVRDLDFYYGKFQGLRKVNLDVARRKVTAFIGPSGCGKSTLLRTLNRMFDLYPGQRAEGRIMFNGRNILDKDQDVNLLRAKVGMVFQKPTPFPMSIYENIAFGIRLYENLSPADMAPVLGSLLQQKASTLIADYFSSGGSAPARAQAIVKAVCEAVPKTSPNALFSPVVLRTFVAALTQGLVKDNSAAHGCGASNCDNASN